MRIRGGSGLGDSIYIRPIAEKLVADGEQVIVCSDWPEVFDGSGAKIEPFSRSNIQVLAHYTHGKSNSETNQWEDVCKSAGIHVPLSFTWNIKNQALIDELKAKADGRRIIVVHGGRVPMGRKDGFGAELLPDRRAFEAVFSQFADCFLVQIGAATQIYPLKVDVDLNGRTSVSDLLDIIWTCDAVIGQCSFVIPAAEAFDKPLLCVWSSEGMASRTLYISQITPKKILSKPSSRFVIDSWGRDKIQEAAYGLVA